MNQAYVEYIRARFAAAAVNTDPFPHLVIENVLPPELYRAMQRDLPSSLECKLGTSEPRIEWWHPRKLGGLPIPVPRVRGTEQPVFAFRPGETTPFLGRYARRWRAKYIQYIDLVDTLTLAVYRPAIQVFMRQLQQAGFIDGEPAPAIIGQGLFTHRTETWRIGAHTHDFGQLIQSMIYFPLPGSTPEQGTVLYRLKSDKTIAGADLGRTLMYEDDEVEPAGLMPYLPNTLASFLNTPLAIHASPDVPGPARRYTFTALVTPGISAPNRDIDLQAVFGDPERRQTAAA